MASPIEISAYATDFCLRFNSGDDSRRVYIKCTKYQELTFAVPLLSNSVVQQAMQQTAKRLGDLMGIFVVFTQFWHGKVVRNVA